MFLLGDCRISDCEMKNLLILLGKLVINNYPVIILEYNHQLSTELKELMTTVINNLQICSQLENKICDLQTKLDVDLEDEILDQKLEFYTNSLSLKSKRLKELQVDNYQLLAEIGEKVFGRRILSERNEFTNIYLELEELIEKGGCIKDIKMSYKNKEVTNQYSKNKLNYINL
ncbi:MULTISPECIES: hypothetical protein [unclassified Candidatus Frackibacter]|uniref:hypothetical protein n=1 Tax=unclassified Candidatus Frackibacter TaxID=2648818 RepID=UPI0008C86110|nr:MULTISPECIES: hypothetical protein [unclassified Candidatus Frackibacter]SEM75007.1 hypothetical protein SAMN04488698_1153 [Candidatus Frackibacter sp. WG12]SFL87238.1 hypothetical protein SAMN04488699_11767 [Candidatus Frackibacter sp. WG13]